MRDGECVADRNMMTWPGPQLLSWKKGMIRKAELEQSGRGKRETLVAFAYRHEASAVPGAPHSLWPPKIPSLILLLALVATSFVPLGFFIFLSDRFSSRMTLRA